ncbi:transketolase [Aureimonas altamirensis DSM 21988]|uniref:Transketolase n=1 Tax=Aureimonas altamirensis DSM 21988 TaxID=1121026 RepID=A0ABY1IHY5_9HYPH|nr:transketolase [Aureimonas altamirensis]SHJ19925.1 transketolase [Aureimonas altamirensis DSM 21988]
MSAEPTPAVASSGTDHHPRDMANAIRALAMDAVQKANSGHPGMPMGMADVAAVLFQNFVHVDPSDPHWPDRDRFVLSNGHGSMLLYALHYLLGYEDMTLDELKNFRQIGARTAGHPEYGHALGIETTTGPLGQGITNAVGFALAERMMNARFGDDLVDHYTYVICGDGCLMEGISHEAIDLAGHLKLNKLIVLFDDNGISIDGKTNLSTSTDQVARFKAAGWDSWHVDGHDVDAIRAAIEKAKTSDKPVMIACKTVIGYGSPKLAGSEKSHGAPLGDEEIAATRKALLWESEPFVIPDAVMKGWRAIAEKNKERRAEWEKRHAAHARKAEFDATVACELPADFAEAMAAYRQKLSDESPKLATRKSSEATLEVINAMTPLTIGGSADLTHSVFTLTKGMASVQADDYGGRYIHYGIREHAMAAVMNGLALHGGFIPYGGTFLVFSDYMRGAMRLSALMGQRVIYVLTHDSIGLGEDGPTHQPVEHLAMLRVTPNINVFRPADAIETAEAWEIALTSTDRPTVLSLSRQNLPTVRAGDVAENRSKRGAYVLREAEGGARQVTLIATGSEIEIALAAADKLKGEGIAAAVVSAPCLDLFAEQDAGYRAEVLGTAPRVAVEAAIGFGWERWIGDNGRFIGMHGFGASGPAPKLYEKFGITADAVAKAARELI